MSDQAIWTDAGTASKPEGEGITPNLAQSKLQFDKVYELYENGKERRYKLLFAINGGAFALVGFLMDKAGFLAGTDRSNVLLQWVVFVVMLGVMFLLATRMLSPSRVARADAAAIRERRPRRADGEREDIAV